MIYLLLTTNNDLPRRKVSEGTGTQSQQINYLDNRGYLRHQLKSALLHPTRLLTLKIPVNIPLAVNLDRIHLIATPAGCTQQKLRQTF